MEQIKNQKVICLIILFPHNSNYPNTSLLISSICSLFFLISFFYSSHSRTNFFTTLFSRSVFSFYAVSYFKSLWFSLFRSAFSFFNSWVSLSSIFLMNKALFSSFSPSTLSILPLSVGIVLKGSVFSYILSYLFRRLESIISGG